MLNDDNILYLKWVQELQAIAQNGLTYSENPFDIERFKRLLEIAAEMGSHISGAPFDKILDLFKQDTHYATPKLDVRGLVFDSQKRILLVQECFDRCWSPPGGWIDVNEPPSLAVTREIFEESGFETKAVKLLAVYDKLKHNHPIHWPHTYKLFFLCELIGGKETTSIETLDVGFFSQDKLPPLSTPRITKEQIDRFYEHLAHPNWPTDFD
jgi:ADP-ribose pyrophosphatase YjhB (NUDIX family)